MLLLYFPLVCSPVVPVPSRFDLEQNQTQAEVQREKSLREKLAREKDIMIAEMFNLRQQLQVSFFTVHNQMYFLSGETLSCLWAFSVT